MLKNKALLSIFAPLVLTSCVETTQLNSEVQTPAHTLVTNESTQAKFSGKLPLDKHILTGTLPNGIKYMIRKNSKPENRAEIRLAIHAGSLFEDDNQQGFAHLVEHMAFNGTEDFKKHAIIDYMQSIGMRFGADLNAHTSFDETVYKLNLPTNDLAALEKGVHILENWAHKITFEPEEIDKERGVVIEELRIRKGAQDRLFKKQLPVLYPDSRYAQRLPIGKQNVLAEGKHEDLVRYYKDWYRPDLMSLVAVGDFEPKDVEALFNQYFSKIKSENKNNKKRVTYTLADNNKPLISVETDDESTNTHIQLSFKQDKLQPKTYQQQREFLTYQAVATMLSTRVKEDLLKPESPLVNARTYYGPFFAHKNMFSFSARVKPEKSQQALSYLLGKLEQAKQHGFTEKEFIRYKDAQLTSYQHWAKQEDKISSKRLANNYVRHLMINKSVPGVVHAAEIAAHFLPTMTVQELNERFSHLYKNTNLLVAVTGPTEEIKSLPNKQQILTKLDEAKKLKLSPYQPLKVSKSLITVMPNTGYITKKHYDKVLDSHTWTLSNGVNVVLKVTDFQEDSINFNARSWGGKTTINDETNAKTLFAAQLSYMMGLGDMNLSQLQTFKKGKLFNLKSKINQTGQNLSGRSSVKDLPYLMQQLHLTFQPPRKDKLAFDSFVARSVANVQRRNNSPGAIFGEAIRSAQNGNNPRSFKTDQTLFEQQDLDASLAVYHQLFSNPADFTFVFVGNIDLVTIEPLIEQYLASMPSKPAQDKLIKPTTDYRTHGKLIVNVEKGVEPKAQIVMKTMGQYAWSFENKAKFDLLKSVLSQRLRERIREDKGGSYGVRVKGFFNRVLSNYQITIMFSCDPTRVDELSREVRQIIAELKKEVVAERYANNFIEQNIKGLETAVKTNSFWLSQLMWYAEPGYAPDSISEHKNLMSELTVEDAKEAANVFLNQSDSLVATLKPQVNNKAIIK